MELLTRITNDARRSGYLRAEDNPHRPHDDGPRLSVYKSSKQRRNFLLLAGSAAILAIAVLTLIFVRQAAGTRFTPGPAPQARGNVMPGGRTSASAEERTSAPAETVYEDITTAAPPREYVTVTHTSPATEAPRNPGNPDPSIPMEAIESRKIIVEIRENGLKREIYLSGNQHIQQIPDLIEELPDDGILSILKMITTGCNVPLTSDESWQDAPPEEETAMAQTPPFNKLMEAINLSVFGVRHPADDLAAGYRKEQASAIGLLFDGADRELFLSRTRKNIDDGYPVIAFGRGQFLLINGYLEAENGEISALYYLDSKGMKHKDELQIFLEMISGVQHPIYYLW